MITHILTSCYPVERGVIRLSVRRRATQKGHVKCFVSFHLSFLFLHRQFSSVQGAWRQSAHWHVQGCVGKAVSPRRRVVTQKLLRREMHRHR